MKKQIFIIIALTVGLSFESTAATGGTTDGFVFIIAIIGFLLMLIALLSGADYLNKNGTKLLNKAMTSVKKLYTLFIDHYRKTMSDFSDLSFF